MRVLLIAVLGILCTACAMTTERSSGVMIVSERSAVVRCVPLGQLQGQSYWGGVAGTGIGYNDALAQLKNEAAAQGGTHVLMVNSSNTAGGTNMIGDAYRCG